MLAWMMEDIPIDDSSNFAAGNGLFIVMSVVDGKRGWCPSQLDLGGRNGMIQAPQGTSFRDVENDANTFYNGSADDGGMMLEG